jgi:hypothetical protein
MPTMLRTAHGACYLAGSSQQSGRAMGVQKQGIGLQQ